MRSAPRAEGSRCAAESGRRKFVQRSSRRDRQKRGRQVFLESLEPRHLLSAVGDFNDDGTLDAADINELVQTVVAATDNPHFDLTNDQRVNAADVDHWVRQIAGTFPGDVDLSGRVNRRDLAAVANHYGAIGTPLWPEANVAPDDRVSLDDLLVVKQNFGAASAGGLPLANQSLALATGLGGLNDSIGALLGAFNLDPTGNLANGGRLPVAQDRLADVFGLSQLAGALAIPFEQPSGDPGRLESLLGEVGVTIEALPTAAGDPLRVRIYRVVGPLSGTAAYNDNTTPLFRTLKPVVDLDGELQYTGSLTLDLTIEVDDGAAYLTNASRVALDVAVAGPLETTLAHDFSATGLTGQGSAAAQLSLVLSPRAVETPLTSAALADPLAHFALATNGTAMVDITLDVLDAGDPTALSYRGTWHVAVENGNVRLMSGNMNPLESIDEMIGQIVAGTNDAQFDLTGDGLVNQNDLVRLVTSVFGTLPGDADLDLDVDRADLARLAANFGRTGVPSWGQGNFNGDPTVSIADLAIWQANVGRTPGGQPPDVSTQISILEAGLSMAGEELGGDWAAALNLSPGDPGGGAAIPLASDQLSEVFGLGDMIGSLLPELGAGLASAVDTPEQLRSILIGLGLEIERFPGGPEGGPDNRDLQVHYQRRIERIVGSSGLDADTLALLSATSPIGSLAAELEYVGALEVDLTLGIDEDGFYIVTSPGGASPITAAGSPGPDAPSTLTLDFDVRLDLSGQILLSEIFELGRAELIVSPRIEIALLAGPDGRLRLDELASGSLAFDVDVSANDLRLVAADARLFPRQSSASFSASVNGLSGSLGDGGAIDLSALRVALDVGGAVNLSANSVAFHFDPTGVEDPTVIARLQNVAVGVPALPSLPVASIGELSLILHRAAETFTIDVQGLQVANSSPATPAPGAATAALDACANSTSNQVVDRPLVLIPDSGFSESPSAFAQFPLASELTTDTTFNIYDSLLATLCGQGYVLYNAANEADPRNEHATLFVANYDWAQSLAPPDSDDDGKLSSITFASLTDDRLEHGVDYLASFLAKAADTWINLPGGDGEPPPGGVDVVAHGTGGLIARAYIQSDACAASDAENPVCGLPPVNQLVMIGTPQAGDPNVAAESEDDWSVDASTVAKVGLGILILGGLGFVGAEVLAGAAVPLAVGGATLGAGYVAVKVGSELLGLEEVTELLDDLENASDAIKFLRKLFPGEQDVAPTAPVIQDEAGSFEVVTLDAPIGESGSSRPTFSWQINLPDGTEPNSAKLYVSTHKPRQGLLPTDRPFVVGKDFDDQFLVPNANGDLDIHPNRILTREFVGGDLDDLLSPSGFYLYELDEGLELTAGQTYYWAVELDTGDDRFGVVTVTEEFKTPPVTTQNRTRFAGVTLITHGFQLPYLDKTVPDDYKEFARHIAKSANGFVFQYDKKTGGWFPDPVANRRGTLRQALEQGRPLVLLSDWAIESSISDSGFSEAAADSLFAGLVQLDQNVKALSPDTLNHPIFESPIHLIGFSRGTPVTAEIAQRIGTFFPGLPEDMHVTTLDPHDFRQDTLDVPLAETLFGLNVLSYIAPVPGLGTVFSAAHAVATLSGNSTVHYGDFRDPEIFGWETVDFHDNYWQNQVQLRALGGDPKRFTCANPPLPDFPLLPDELACGFTPNGRPLSHQTPIPSFDPNTHTLQPADPDDRWQLDRNGPAARSSADFDLELNGRAGFTSDNGLGGPHMRAKSWYIGTANLGLDHFPFSEDVEEEWGEPIGEDEDVVVRRRADLERYAGVDQPWYLARETEIDVPWRDPQTGAILENQAPREGIGTGWYYSTLGGGKEHRPSDQPGLKKPVSYDNSKYPSRYRGTDPAVPTVFNGHFDVSIHPKFGRFPLPAIPSIDDCDSIVCLGPSWKEIPGWSFHGGSGGLLQGDNIFDLVQLNVLQQAFGALLTRTVDEAAQAALEQIGDEISRKIPKTLPAVAGAVGTLVQLPLEVLDLLGIGPGAYAENQYLEYLQLRERGLLNQAYEISDVFSDLTHNRFFIPASATALEFKYWVTEEGTNDGLEVVFSDGLNLDGTLHRVPCSEFIADCLISLNDLNTDLTDDGFVTKTIPIPASMRGRVGTFTVKTLDAGIGVGFTAAVLLDDFRLVSDDVEITDNSGASDDGIIFFSSTDNVPDPVLPASRDGLAEDDDLTNEGGNAPTDDDAFPVIIDPPGLYTLRFNLQNSLANNQSVTVTSAVVSPADNGWLHLQGIGDFTPPAPLPLFNTANFDVDILDPARAGGGPREIANGQSLEFEFVPKLPPNFLATFQADAALLSTTITFTMRTSDGVEKTKTQQLFYWIDAADEDMDDQVLKFADTLAGEHRRMTVFIPDGVQFVRQEPGDEFVITHEPASGNLPARAIIDFFAPASGAGQGFSQTLVFRLGNRELNPAVDDQIDVAAQVTAKRVIDVPTFEVTQLLEELFDCRQEFANSLPCARDPLGTVDNYAAFLNLTELRDGVFDEADAILVQQGIQQGVMSIYDSDETAFVSGGQLAINFKDLAPAPGSGITVTTTTAANVGITDPARRVSDTSRGRAASFFASGDLWQWLFNPDTHEDRLDQLSTSSIRFIADQMIGYEPTRRVSIFVDSIVRTLPTLDFLPDGDIPAADVVDLFDLGRAIGRIISHEVGHNFGLTDQYAYSTAIRESLPIEDRPPFEADNFMQNLTTFNVTPEQKKSLTFAFDLPDFQDVILDADDRTFSRILLTNYVDWLRQVDAVQRANHRERPLIYSGNAPPEPPEDGSSPPAPGFSSTARAPAASSPGTSVNPTTVPHLRNNFLLDLNAGGSAGLSLDPRVFAGVGGVTAIYSGGVPTANSYTTRLGEDFGRNILSLREHEAVPAANDRSWLEANYAASSGDGRVPLFSSVLPLLGIEGVRTVAATNGDLTHAGLASNAQVQQSILSALGRNVPIEQIVPSTARTDMSHVVSLAHVGTEALVVDAQGRRLGFTTATGVLTEIPGSVYRGGTTGIGYIFEAVEGPLTYQLTGTGGNFFVQATALGSKQSGGTQLHGTLAAGQTRTETFEINEVFELPGVPTLLELVNPSLSGNFTITIQPDGAVVTGDITVSADGAALFPDTSTPELDGMVTATDFDITISLETGSLHLVATTAAIDVEGVVTGSAASVSDPENPGQMLPGFELNLGSGRIDASTVIGALRGLELSIPALDGLPTDLVEINAVEIRRDGFGFDVTVGDPAGSITLGGDSPIVELTGPEVHLDLDVTLAGGLRVAGTVAVSAATAALFPEQVAGGGFGGELSGVVATLDLATGEITLAADELTLQLADLLVVTAADVELNLTAALDDPGATILSVPTATLTAPKLRTANGQPVSVALTGLTLRGDGFSLASAVLPPGDMVFDSLVEFDDLTISLSNLSFSATAGFAPGGLTMAAAGAAIVPDLSTPVLDGLALIAGLNITLDLASGEFRLTAASFNASLGGIVDIIVEQSTTGQPIEINLTDDPDAFVFFFPIVTADFVGMAVGDLTPTITLTNVGLKHDGSWRLGTAVLDVPADYTFGVAAFLPFAVTRAGIDFAEDAQGNPNLDQFDVAVCGQFNLDQLREVLPFEPIISIGDGAGGGTLPCDLPNGGNGAVRLEIAVESLTGGRIGLKGLGPIRVGVEDWQIGELVFDGELALGRFDQNGTLLPITPGGPQIEGFLSFDTSHASSAVQPTNAENFAEADDTPLEDSSGTPVAVPGNDETFSIDAGNIALAGTVTTAGGITTAAFDLAADLKLRFKLANLFELYGVGFDLSFALSNPVGGFAPAFDFTLNTLEVDYMRMALGDDDASEMSVTARGYTDGAGVYHPALRLNFNREADEPYIAEIGTLGMHFPGVSRGSQRFGATVVGLNILPGGIPDLFNIDSILFELGGFFSPENAIFSWLPFRVDTLGMKFHPQPFNDVDGDGTRDPGEAFLDTNNDGRFNEGVLEVDAAGNIIGLGNPLAFSLLFSGGLDQSGLADGFEFPITATVTDLELDLEALANGEFPIKNLGGVKIAVDPFALIPDVDLPFTVRGGLSFGSVMVGAQKSIYGRIFGDFKIEGGIGAGIDLVISDRGPLLASVLAPLGIPLGPTSLVLTNVEGGIAFGVGELRSVNDPFELITDPVFIDPFDIDDAEIIESLEELLAQDVPDPSRPGQFIKKYTWEESFSIGLTGTVITLAAPGVFQGEASLGVNVVFQGPNQGVRLFGNANATVYGLPLGRAGLLVDLANVLAPEINFAFAAPAPGNPLGFLLPARAEFALRLETDGMIEAPLIGLRTFVEQGAAGVLDLIATQLQRDHSRPLAQLLLDTNGGGVSAAEDLQSIDGDFIVARVLGTVGSPLLPVSFTTIGASAPAAAAFASALLDEYFLAAGQLEQVFRAIEAGDEAAKTALVAQGAVALRNLGDVLLRAAISGGLAAWEGFNPSLVVRGIVQPTVFGFPLGEPTDQVDIIINKELVSFGIRTSLIRAMKSPFNQLSGGYSAPLLDLITLGFEDRTSFAFSLDLPFNDIISGLITAGQDVLDGNGQPLATGLDLADLLVDTLNPFANWEVALDGEMTWLGFRMANVSGVMFGPQTFTDPMTPDPQGLADTRIVDLDPDNDGTPNADLVELTENTPLLVPVSRHTHYLNMMRNGGILLTGRLFLPEILRDPVGVFESINWQPPDVGNLAGNPLLIADAFGKYTDWLNSIVTGLTQDSEYAKVQMYIPSPARLFDLDTYFDAANPANSTYLQTYGADEDNTRLVETLVAGPGAGLTQANSEPFEDRNRDGVRQANEPFEDLDGNGQFFAGGFFQDLGNGIYDGPEPFVDAGNGTYDRGEPFADGNRDGLRQANEAFTDVGNGLRDASESFTDLDGDGQFDAGEAFTDVGNGVYDAGEVFVDANNNGVFNAGETFTDAGNGRYDSAEPFDNVDGSVDALRNATFTPGDTFTDRNQNGQFDAGEPFVDVGNGLFDGIAAGGSPPPPRLGLSGEAITQEILDIFNSFYIEGYADIKLFSINFGKGFFGFDRDGFNAEITVPGLAGLIARARVGLRDLDTKQLGKDLLTSPLVAHTLGALGFGSAAIQGIVDVLNNPNLPVPQLPISFPVASFEASISTAGVAQWLSSFGLPHQLLAEAQQAVSADASLAFYSPGFADAATTPDADRIKVFGGIRFDAHADILGFVDDAAFHFDVEFFDNLANPASFFLPNFTATASINELNLGGGLGGMPQLVRLQGITPGESFRVSLAKRDTLLSGGVSGKVVLLPGNPNSLTATAVGNIFADLNPADPALWGSIDLTGTGGGFGNGADYNLDAAFSLRINTDNTARPIPPVNPTLQVDPGLFIHAEGVFHTEGFHLDGAFDLSVDPATAALRIEAEDIDVELTLGGQRVMDLEGDAGLLVSPSGVAVVAALNFAAGPVGQFDLSLSNTANFLLEVNTTLAPVPDLAGHALTAGPTGNASPQAYARLRFDADITTQNFVFGGSFALTVTPTLFELSAIDVDMAVKIGSTTVFRLDDGDAAVRITSQGIAAYVDFSLDVAPTSVFDFDFAGSVSFELEVNTTGAQQILPGNHTLLAGPTGNTPASNYGRLVIDGAIAAEGFELDGRFALTVSATVLDISATDVDLVLAIGNNELLSLNGDGALRITSTGIAAGLSMSFTGGAGNNDFGFRFDTSVDFDLEINTTLAQQNLTGFSLPASPSGGPAEEYGRVHVDGFLQFGDFRLEGEVDVTVGTNTFRLDTDGPVTLSLGELGTYSVNSFIDVSSAGVVADLSLSRQGGSLFFEIDGNLNLQINTTGSTQQGIPVGIRARISNASIDILGFTFAELPTITVGFNPTDQFFFQATASESVDFFGFAVDEDGNPTGTMEYDIDLRGSGLIDIGMSLDFDPPFGIEIPFVLSFFFDSASFNIHRNAGSFGQLSFSGSLSASGSIFIYDASIDASMTAGGCATLEITYERPRNPLVGDFTPVTEMLDLFVNFNRGIFSQDVFDPDTVEADECTPDQPDPPPPPPPPVTVTLSGGSTATGGANLDQFFVQTIGGMVKKIRRLVVSESSDAIVLSATGLPASSQVTVHYQVDALGLTPPTGPQTGVDFVLGSGDLTFVAGGARTLTVAQIIEDLRLELDEPFAINFTVTGHSANIDLVLSYADRIEYTIRNDEPEGAGLIFYDFDTPHPPDDYDFTRFATVGDSHVSATAFAHSSFPVLTEAAGVPKPPPNTIKVAVSPAVGVNVWATQATFSNLLVNGGAESPLSGGNLPGWSETTGTAWTLRSANPAALEGRNYFTVGDGTALAELSQLVDLTSMASAIDRGLQRFEFSGFASQATGESPADQTQIIVEYLRADRATVLDSFDSGAFSTTLTTWSHVTDVRTAPAGARFARVRLIGRRVTGTTNDAFFDDIVFRATDNLLVNPSNEDPNRLKGWTTVGSAGWTQRASNPLPQDGRSYFAPSGTQTSAELRQEVSVSTFASAIDTGRQVFELSGFVRSLAETPLDTARIRAEYLAADGTSVLATVDTGAVAVSNQWAALSERTLAPVGTRSIRVRLLSTRLSSLGIDGYFDDLSLRALPADEFYTFSVTLDDGPPLAPEDVRMTLTGMTFYDFADAGSPFDFVLTSSHTGFGRLIGAGSASRGNYGAMQQLPLGPEFGCLQADQTPIEFRLSGSGPAGRTWRIDNLGVQGFIHPRGACNTPPVAVDDAVETPQAVPVNINVIGNDSDPDGDTVVLSGFDTTSARGGAVTNLGGGQLRYVPASSFAGTDSFGYTIKDGHGGEDSGVVTITVVAPPIAVGDSASGPEDTVITIGDVTLNDQNPAGGVLTLISFTLPAKGSLVRNGNAFTYTPNPNSVQDDSFTYTIRDRFSRTSTGTVTIDVIPVNDVPVASNPTVMPLQGQTITIPVSSLATDADGGSLSITAVGTPTRGSKTFNSSQITYTASSTTGTGTMTYTVSDGQGGSVNGTVNITVRTNNPPVANAGPNASISNLAFSAPLTGSGSSDPDGLPLTFQWTGPVPITHIGPSFSNASFNPRPFCCNDQLTFTLTVSDGFHSRSDTVTITVTGTSTTGGSPAAPSAAAPPDTATPRREASSVRVRATAPETERPGNLRASRTPRRSPTFDPSAVDDVMRETLRLTGAMRKRRAE